MANSAFLLDTHTWLWWHTEPERLPGRVRGEIADPSNDVRFSAASAWEIAIKFAINKLKLPGEPRQYVPAQLAIEGFAIMPVELSHALRVAELPPHHPDPFDRLLVAQAQCEALTILSGDPQLRKYDIAVLW